MMGPGSPRAGWNRPPARDDSGSSSPSGAGSWMPAGGSRSRPGRARAPRWNCRSAASLSWTSTEVRVTDQGGSSAPPDRIRVMVVDDHPMWRTGVARDLTEAGYDVAAAVGEGAQAVRVAAAVRPDVVVLDLQLPDRSGVEVIRGLLAEAP